MPRTVNLDALRCSFCAKSQSDVVKLVAGPGVFICNECIDLCNQIITEEMARKGGSAEAAVRSDKTSDPPTLKAWDGLSDEDLSLRWSEPTLPTRTSTVPSPTTSQR